MSWIIRFSAEITDPANSPKGDAWKCVGPFLTKRQAVVWLTENGLEYTRKKMGWGVSGWWSGRVNNNMVIKLHKKEFRVAHFRATIQKVTTPKILFLIPD